MDTISPLKPATEGQIGKTSELLTARLRKNNKEIPGEYLQKVLETTGGQMVNELYEVVRKYVDAQGNLIVRLVKVDRTRSAKEALQATGRTLYLNDDVVANAPKGTGEEVELILFHLGRSVSDNDLEKEYELRGAVPADLHSIAALNESDPAFADERPYGTHWKDKNGNWCFATFDRWHGDRDVLVSRDGVGWRVNWWFAGVRKSASNSETLVS